MELETIITLVTIVISWLCGFLAKKSTWVSNNLIPIQNIAIGLIVAVIEWVVTKDFKLAIALSGLIAGGSYDVIHNIKKIYSKEEE